MGYKQATQSIQVVALTGGYSATVQQLRKVDDDACTSALVGVIRSHIETGDSAADAKQVIDQSMDSAAYTTEMLARGIAEWTLDDDSGQPLPINHQTVQLLTARDAQTLVLAIKALSEGLPPN